MTGCYREHCLHALLVIHKCRTIVAQFVNVFKLRPLMVVTTAGDTGERASASAAASLSCTMQLLL